MNKIFRTFIIILFIVALFPNNIFASTRWEYEALNVNDINLQNENPIIKIAVIDSGIINNDYLNPYISEGYNFIDNNTDCVDTYGHGTKVSSILIDLAQETNLNIQLIPLKVVTNEGKSSTENVIRAINYAIGQKVNIINISMVSKNNNPDLFNAIQNAKTNNIIVVSGIGNDGTSVLNYPSSYDGVISVGSINQDQQKSWFSNYNDKLDILATGEKISMMELNGTYGLHSGTSFSTPFVTFQVALLKAYYPYLQNNEIIKIINETAIDKGEVGFDNYYGNGVINYKNAIDNAYKALEENYVDWKTYSNVSLDKIWTITFNGIVQNTGKISIVDEYYNVIPINITVNGSKVVITPLSNYKSNTIYSLTISDLISSNNIKLKNNVKMKFKTVENSNLMSVKDRENPILMPSFN